MSNDVSHESRELTPAELEIAREKLFREGFGRALSDNHRKTVPPILEHERKQVTEELSYRVGVNPAFEVLIDLQTAARFVSLTPAQAVAFAGHIKRAAHSATVAKKRAKPIAKNGIVVIDEAAGGLTPEMMAATLKTVT